MSPLARASAVVAALALGAAGPLIADGCPDPSIELRGPDEELVCAESAPSLRAWSVTCTTYEGPRCEPVHDRDVEVVVTPEPPEGEPFPPGSYTIVGRGCGLESEPVELDVVAIDVDVDSDNDSPGADHGPQGDDGEEEIEDDPALPGRWVLVNLDDDDDDGVLDWVDGYGLDPVEPDDGQTPGEDDFVRVVLRAPAPVDLGAATFRLQYDASNPAAAGGLPPHPAPGRLRLWRKPGGAARNPARLADGGDWVAPGDVYTAAELGITAGGTSFWLEAVAASPSVGADQIRLELDPDGEEGDEGFGCADAARVTAVAIELVDAQAFGPTMTHALSGDPAAQVGAVWLRRGAFADGLSVLVARVQPTQALARPVQLDLAHDHADPLFPQASSHAGSLHTTFPPLPAPEPGGATGGLAAAFAAGAPKIAYLRPPNNFLFGNTLDRQALTLSLSIDGVAVGSRRVDLVRPWVVLAHGFTSNPGNLSRLNANLHAGGTKVSTVFLDYSDINTSGFDDVAARIKPRVDQVLQVQRREGIAATRVDWVGHSMGGVVAKLYAANIPFGTTIPRLNGFPNFVWVGAPFLRPENFGRGDLRRIVTIGSPLRGSPLGDLFSATLGWNGTLHVVASVPSLTGNGAALDDLGMFGPVTGFLVAATAQVSWYPIVGRAAPGRTQADLGPTFIALFDAIGIAPSDVGLLPGNSDIVVFTDSQADATFFPPPGISHALVTSVTHGEEPASLIVASRVRRALDLLFSSPDNPGYLEGHTLFNPGF